jgi:Family of unknown function (DUF6510)
MTEDLHIDGNGVAGLMGEIAAAEFTAMMRTCQSCHERNAMGAHLAYKAAGVVLRCPSCNDVAIRIGVQDQRLVVDWRGTYEIARA